MGQDSHLFDLCKQVAHDDNVMLARAGSVSGFAIPTTGMLIP